MIPLLVHPPVSQPPPAERGPTFYTVPDSQQALQQGINVDSLCMHTSSSEFHSFMHSFNHLIITERMAEKLSGPRSETGALAPISVGCS